MSNIGSLVSQLVSEMAKGGAPAILNTGLPVEEITKLTSRLPFSITAELVELYQYCDGIDQHAPYAFDIVEGQQLMPLNVAVQFYGYSKANMGEGRGEYRKSWFPLLTSDGGGDLVVECGDGHTRGSVISYNPAMGNKIQFTSIESMFGTIVEFWKQGVYVLQGDIVVVTGPDADYYEIGARMNPGAEYWRRP